MRDVPPPTKEVCSGTGVPDLIITPRSRNAALPPLQRSRAHRRSCWRHLTCLLRPRTLTSKLHGNLGGPGGWHIPRRRTRAVRNPHLSARRLLCVARPPTTGGLQVHRSRLASAHRLRCLASRRGVAHGEMDSNFVGGMCNYGCDFGGVDVSGSARSIRYGRREHGNAEVSGMNGIVWSWFVIRSNFF